MAAESRSPVGQLLIHCAAPAEVQAHSPMRTHRDPVHQCVQLKYLVAIILLLCGVVAVPVVEAGHPQQSTSRTFRHTASDPRGDDPSRQLEAKAKEASEAQSQIVDLRGKLAGRETELSAVQAKRDAEIVSADNFMIGAFVLIGFLVAILAYLFAAKRRTMWPFGLDADSARSGPELEQANGVQARLWKLIQTIDLQRLRAAVEKTNGEIAELVDDPRHVSEQTLDTVRFAILVARLQDAKVLPLDADCSKFAVEALRDLSKEFVERHKRRKRNEENTRCGLEEELLAEALSVPTTPPDMRDFATEAWNRAADWHPDSVNDRRVWGRQQRDALKRREFKRALRFLAKIIDCQRKDPQLIGQPEGSEIPDNFVQRWSTDFGSVILCDILRALDGAMEARVADIDHDKLCTWAKEAIERLQEGLSEHQRLVALMRCTRIFKNGNKEYQSVLERAWDLVCPKEHGNARNTLELLGLGEEGKKLVEDVCGWWLDLNIGRDLKSVERDFAVLPKLLSCVYNTTRVVQGVCGEKEARGFLEPRLQQLEQTERGLRMVQGAGAEREEPEERECRVYIAGIRRWQPPLLRPEETKEKPPPKAFPNIWLKFDERAEKIVVSDHSTGNRNSAATVQEIKVLNNARQPIRRRGWFGNALYNLGGTPHPQPRESREAPNGNLYVELGEISLGNVYRPNDETWHVILRVEGVPGELDLPVTVLRTTGEMQPPDEWPPNEARNFCETIAKCLISLAATNPNLEDEARSACEQLFCQWSSDQDAGSKFVTEFKRAVQVVGVDFVPTPEDLWGRAIGVRPGSERPVINRLLGPERFSRLREAVSQRFKVEIPPRSGEPESPLLGPSDSLLSGLGTSGLTGVPPKEVGGYLRGTGGGGSKGDRRGSATDSVNEWIDKVNTFVLPILNEVVEPGMKELARRQLTRCKKVLHLRGEHRLLAQAEDLLIAMPPD